MKITKSSPVARNSQHLSNISLTLDSLPGVAIAVENPREVGADRIVNAVAAYDLALEFAQKRIRKLVPEFVARLECPDTCGELKYDSKVGLVAAQNK